MSGLATVAVVADVHSSLDGRELAESGYHPPPWRTLSP